MLFYMDFKIYDNLAIKILKLKAFQSKLFNLPEI